MGTGGCSRRSGEIKTRASTTGDYGLWIGGRSDGPSEFTGDFITKDEIGG